MAVRLDGAGRMKNVNESEERRECRWLETSASYTSCNMSETGLNVTVEVIRKKGKGERTIDRKAWTMAFQETPHFQNAGGKKNSMLYNDFVLKH